jgi:hypothetical protein
MKSSHSPEVKSQQRRDDGTLPLRLHQSLPRFLAPMFLALASRSSKHPTIQLLLLLLKILLHVNDPAVLRKKMLVCACG